MKKLFLMLLILLTMTVNCFAYTPDSYQWEWITSTDSYSVYIQKKHINYHKNYNGDWEFEFWVLWTEPSKNEYSIRRNFITYKEKKLATTTFATYDEETGHVKDSGELSKLFSDIIPGTLGDAIYERVCQRLHLKPL